MASGTKSSGVVVLIPAAGHGTRMGGDRKQFRLLGGKSILVRTIEAFESSPEVDWIVVAAPRGSHPNVDGIAKVHAVVDGGESRQASVAAALRSAPAEADIVLVHDAVRPFVTQDEITDVIEAVRRHGAAALAVPVSDTLRKGSEGTFAESVARSGLYRMLTPQGCRRDWFEEAHSRARTGVAAQTDDVELIRQIGKPVAIVEGRSTNMKITHASDWELAQVLWKERQ